MEPWSVEVSPGDEGDEDDDNSSTGGLKHIHFHIDSYKLSKMEEFLGNETIGIWMKQLKEVGDFFQIVSILTVKMKQMENIGDFKSQNISLISVWRF